MRAGVIALRALGAVREGSSAILFFRLFRVVVAMEV